MDQFIGCDAHKNFSVFVAATPPATKVRAADSILDHTAKAIEIEDIDARAELERAAEESNPGRQK